MPSALQPGPARQTKCLPAAEGPPSGSVQTASQTTVRSGPSTAHDLVVTTDISAANATSMIAPRHSIRSDCSSGPIIARAIMDYLNMVIDYDISIVCQVFPHLLVQTLIEVSKSRPKQS
jgi:hypothetical protein